ncbi:hypothetical protein PFLUV_G00029630 [Perca fluviatilis]|uniref:Ubiquitin-like protease family profile domain-containing protein n=1 Tax=Perca fluviatilis TaxID=8168 RepID=A0A6A5FJV1_PERFL|nr:hypothetical protein PFLUV_G00029630 [Perca fluviatilis]
MDSAGSPQLPTTSDSPSSDLSFAVASQGALLGQHATAISAMAETLRSLVEEVWRIHFLPLFQSAGLPVQSSSRGTLHRPASASTLQPALLRSSAPPFQCLLRGFPAPVSPRLPELPGLGCQRVSDIEPVPEDFTGEVNVEDFWDSVSLEMIARGLTSSNRKNPFTVHPSYHFWAPWIGQDTRRSNTVLNTEFLKAQGPRNSAEADDINITEDRLSNELMKLKAYKLQDSCMEATCLFDAGGLAAIICPCAVFLYSLKFNIRAEGPRDFADMLLSWKHMPNISVYDFARGLVNHTNVRVPENPPFQPNEGRLAPPTPENIQAAKDRTLKIHLSWLLEPNTENFEDESHQVTKSSQHYVLCDKLHEGNSKDEKDMLRRIELVPEIAGQPNSQVAEQFFANMRKNNYFINNMSPSAHIFLVRNIVHHHNEKKERQTIEKMKRNVRNRIKPGEWTVIYSKDIKGLPSQEDGNACGIFMLMYALYIVLGADFDFTTGDMDKIRTWWCLLLLSGHSVVRFAQKRKYEDQFIIADKDKEEAKRPRIIPPQQLEPVDLTKEGILEVINVSELIIK